MTGSSDKFRIKDLSPDDRPREKLILKGSQSLSDAELIAIILRTGTKGKTVLEVAQNLIKDHGNLAQLASKSVENFTQNLGIGKDKAATLAAAFELSRRISVDQRWFSKQKITSPGDVAKIFGPLLRDEMQEKFFVICLNSANKIIKYKDIFTGTLNSSIIHPREIFKFALDNNSANIILLHNHPSGNLEPSGEDVQITKRLVDAGTILGIKVFDHIIIAENSYFSFVEKKII
ncbi:MAG: DNA repair protein RadC [Melioribacteraceae bacterium]|nr:DNA repair protein RadC [Melioribacteraceae bacterium]MDD3557832.1 DNA repair protein RadC [Melioribacteraceae bacterium]